MKKIIEKIKKLLVVAAGEANEQESTLALAMATRLMAKYSIDEAMVSTDDDPDELPGDVMIYVGARPPQWAMSLALGLCSANNCRVARIQGRGLRIYGFESDRARVRVLWDIIEPQIHQWAKYRCSGLGRRVTSSYRWGMAYTIGKLLEAATEAETAERFEVAHQECDTSALVLLDKTLARKKDREIRTEQHFESQVRGGYFKPKTRMVRGAFEQGERDGKNVNLTGERPALT